MTALAIVILCMGSLIPVNTYLSPVLCILLTRPVLQRCGRNTGWCYYLATAALGLMLAPDREAALVYALLGFYPMVKGFFDRLPGAMVWKLVFFTAVGAGSFFLSAAVLGIPLEAPWLMAATLVLWDVLFALVDRLLELKKR